MTEKNIESNVSIPDEKKTTEDAVEAKAISENVVSDEPIVKETKPKTVGIKELEEIPVILDSGDESSSDSDSAVDSESSESTESTESTEGSIDDSAEDFKLPIVLDLDETLLHAVSTKELHDKFSSRAQKAMLANIVKSLKVHDMKDTDEKGKERSFYIVFERPGLQDFLDYLFDNFKVLVWTAATKDYAAFIVDKILIQGKPRKLHYLFVNHHGKKSAKKFGKRHRKKLEMLVDFYKIPDLAKNGDAGVNKLVPVIIDDNEHVLQSQPNQCVVAPAYVLFDDEMNVDHSMINDKFLEQLQMGLEQYKLESESHPQNDPAKIISRGMLNKMASQN